MKKGALVQIKWQDSNLTHGWRLKDFANTDTIANCRHIGILQNETENDITIAFGDSDMDSLSECITIPKGTIKRNQEIKISMREKPSPPDIVPKDSISIIGNKVIVDYTRLNIPFSEPPMILPIDDIPDTNSMDGVFDYGHNLLYIKPVNIIDHVLMTDWIIKQFEDSKGLLRAHCVYRIMADDNVDPYDFSKPHKNHGYAIHELRRIRKIKLASNHYSVELKFKGVNNWSEDLYWVRPKNILYLSTGIIF